jgi:hypothetical protein
MSNKNEVQEFAGGDVYFWLEAESSIMLKATTKGDPVELGAEEVREIAAALIVMAQKLEALDSPNPTI